MSSFLEFMGFSVLEYFSVLYISLTLWSFNTKNIHRIIYLSIILSAISYLFRDYGLDGLSPIYSLLSMIIIFIIFYRAKIKYSLFIAVSGYGVSALAQVALLGVLLLFHVIKYDEVSSLAFTFKGHMLQLGTFILIMIISLRIKVYKSGLEFVPEDKYRLKNPVMTNTVLLLLSIFISLFIILTFFALIYFKVDVLIYVFLIGLIILISSLLFSLYKRDSEEFGHLG